MSRSPPSRQSTGGRFARFGAEYAEAALSARGRRLLVADPSEVDDDLVGEVAEILASLCARLYGRRAAADRARRAVASARGGALAFDKYARIAGIGFARGLLE